MIAVGFDESHSRHPQRRARRLRPHSARELARPLAALGLSLTNPAARLFPTNQDRDAVKDLLDKSGTMIALHPGSGSGTKNWPIENWIKLGDVLLADGHCLMIIAGEA